MWRRRYIFLTRPDALAVELLWRYSGTTTKRRDGDMADWVYCSCAGKHEKDCPNNKPGGLPPLSDDDD